MIRTTRVSKNKPTLLRERKSPRIRKNPKIKWLPGDNRHPMPMNLSPLKTEIRRGKTSTLTITKGNHVPPKKSVPDTLWIEEAEPVE